jgi:hypothetical protein
LTSHIDEFGVALLDSMDEAIASLLSQDVADAFRSNLKAKRSISPEEIPDNLPTISVVLKKYFGPSAEAIEDEIAHSLYSKCGLEFRKIEDCNLTEYVEIARKEFKPTGPERLPLREDFDGLLVESVREAIEDALGKDSGKAFLMLERDVTFDKLPRHLSTFYITLDKIFGKDRSVIEMAIAKKLYQKLRLDFVETPNTELARYVESAIIKLSQREQAGVNLPTKTEHHRGSMGNTYSGIPSVR